MRIVCYVGTVAVLVETGESSAAIEWGLAWLDTNPMDQCTPDVVILVASAYCDAAGTLLEKNASNTLEAYTMLHQAKLLMDRHNTGIDLLPDIIDSIEVSNSL